MASQINGPLSNNASIVAEQRRTQGKSVQPDASRERTPQTSTTRAESLTLSDAASNLRNLEQQLADRPVVDQDRVSAVKRAIESGEFRVEPTRVAEKMMAFEALINAKLGS